MCNYWLGGTDYFDADRDEADRILAVLPQARDLARDNRAFGLRAVKWAASQGIRQFLDLGSGIPSEPSVHSAARSVHPDARMAYVDRSPMAVLMARAMLDGMPGTAAVAGDLRSPAAVLADPRLNAVIGLGEPACILLTAVLHYTDTATARHVAAAYARAAAPGSCLVMSAARVADPALARRTAAALTSATWRSHSEEEIQGWFAGLRVVPPGITDVRTWRPERPAAVGPRAAYVYGGAGMRP